MATSLVAKVLGKSGRFAKEEVSTVLENLSQKIDEVKGEVNNVIQKQYKEFLAVYADTGELMSRAQHVTEEMQLLEDRIENELLHQVKSATSEQRELSSRLETSEAKVELLRLLCKNSQGMQGAQTLWYSTGVTVIV
ncbi:centromere/kinetochore protein zw10 homolog isoform X3 [Corticium candelabrum]|uniref:centromere/kinetochore protein zw10 homolog isoform X3 n=1 Tax=Corticium candelabrum TaxID=121492 RepID=UPI002E26E9BA|nr:centromere/kinetochore protein zw10 homolog isoform X3 [Corticium candelabrum]